MALATCFDDPAQVAKDNVCIVPVSKNVVGKLTVREGHQQRCAEQKCETTQTTGSLSVSVKANAACDSKRSREIDGTFLVRLLSAAYDVNGARRGVHAGDFVWTATNKKISISGRLSGITNAGILRKSVFKPACEECLAPHVMIGRLCGRVVKSTDQSLKGASLVAVYRFEARDGSTNGPVGAVKGTIEGVLVPQC